MTLLAALVFPVGWASAQAAAALVAPRQLAVVLGEFAMFQLSLLSSLSIGSNHQNKSTYIKIIE